MLAPLREPKASVPEGGCDYKILPKIDQKVVFDKVFKVLAKNGTIGIFPEGGSHDQGHLIPLKAGVTIMALGAASQGTPVKIVPCGLTYFHAHRFRSKVSDGEMRSDKLGIPHGNGNFTHHYRRYFILTRRLAPRLVLRSGRGSVRPAL